MWFNMNQSKHTQSNQIPVSDSFFIPNFDFDLKFKTIQTHGAESLHGEQNRPIAPNLHQAVRFETTTNSPHQT